MTEILTITADREDCAVELSGSLQLKEFSGFGEGWFNSSDIKAFCSNLHELSRNMKGTAEIIGGHGYKDTPDYLECFSLRVYPLDESKLNGTVGVHITLAHPPYTGCRKEEICKMSGEMLVRNHNVEKFANELSQLLDGGSNQVLLHGGNSI